MLAYRIKKGESIMFNKILVPTDGSESALKAAQYALVLAQQFNGSITLIHIVQQYYNLPSLAIWDAVAMPPSVINDIEEMGRNILNNTRQALGDTTVKVYTRLEYGQPAERIVRIAKNEGFSEIILGNRGLSGFNQLLLGSVSNQVAYHASCPVLIIKEDTKKP
jgi:nucleotide-binding universal stress UspA family protein